MTFLKKSFEESMMLINKFLQIGRLAETVDGWVALFWVIGFESAPVLFFLEPDTYFIVFILFCFILLLKR